MISWQDQLRGDSISWLLESEQPAVRYLALRDLTDIPESDAEFQALRSQAHQQGPIAEVLAAMHPEGFWVEPGPGYNPKYRSSVWSLILLAQLGASVKEDSRIRLAIYYLLDHNLTRSGQFTTTGTPSGTVDCLQGNLLWALQALGCEASRLDTAMDWMARSVTGEGISPADDRNAPIRYYAAKCGPKFACGANNGLPCAWGAVKVMLALGKWPVERSTPIIQQAVQAGIDFLFSVNPTDAAYPSGFSDKPSQNWWKFGFPVFYVTDLLQVAEALIQLGCASDPRMSDLLSLIRNKQDANGRWVLEYDYTGKTWVNFGPKKVANQWVTLRAARVLKAAY